MKRIRKILLLCLALVPLNIYAQNYNQERIALTNFLVRMYENAPFEGVRAVDDYEQKYLISVLTLDPSKYGGNESTMFRVAGVKAMSQASRFFNGSKISTDLIIRNNEKSDGNSDTEMIETINENSLGFVKSLELLKNFSLPNGHMAFIYFTPIKNQQSD